MSPPEVWGPAVWTLFHTLAEKINPDAYPYVIQSMFAMFVRICAVLPCPECSRDASGFLAKIKLSDYKTKDDFKNMLYLFHNWVNAKKRKPLFNYANMNKYADKNLILVINDFIAKYNTKGNMKLLAESFQRSFVLKDFVNWFKKCARAFIKPRIRKIDEVKVVEDMKESVAEEENNEILEDIKEEVIIDEVNDIKEESLIKEDEVIIEDKKEENIVMTITDEPVVDENKPKKRRNKKKQ